MRNKQKNKKSIKLMLYLVVICSIFIFHADSLYALDVDFYDSYTSTGNSFDNIVWEDSTCPNPSLWITLGVYNPANPDVFAYCVNMNKDDGDTYDACFFENQDADDNCTNASVSFPVTPVTLSMSSATWFYADEVTQLQDVTCGVGDGNTISDGTKESNRGQISYYCSTVATPDCHLCGSTSDVSTYDYFFIDEIFIQCISDGSNDYDVRGKYTSSSHIQIENWLCPSNYICDTDHDEDLSTSEFDDKDDLDNPCRLEEDEACNVQEDCWGNLVCDGEDRDYNGECDGVLVDIQTNHWLDSCGGSGVQDEFDILYQNDKSCVTDGGFPVGFICDTDFEDIDRATINEVYNDICKGGEGNSCTIDSDCHHSFECVGGFCAYDIFVYFDDNVTPNKILKGESISFDNSLSFASDENIQYACWKIDSVNTECDGNSTQCSSSCNGASFDSVNWDNGFINTFNSGGNFQVTLLSGSEGLYSDSLSDTYCVSGDGTFCYSCFDGIKNDDETLIDWGGHCGFPYFIRCTNNILDNVTNETSIDYGGACGSCDNSSVETDIELSILKDTELVVYPFDNSLCEEAEAIQGSVVLFVLVVSAIIIIIPLFIFAIVFVLILFLGTGIIGLLFGIYRNINKDKNRKK